jgi:hypothetical protein
MFDRYFISFNSTIPIQRTLENVCKKNVINDSEVFSGDILFSGCTGDVFSQENHILSTKGGSVSPKNIVLQTFGSNNTFGSFLRDDTLTSPKGDVRGSGANDLSVSRELCSQVASGDFSSILSGRNNTSSGDGSLVIGGRLNIADSSNCLVIGGIGNVSSGGFNNSIVTGLQNSTSQLKNDISGILLDISNSLVITGTNVIMNGNNSVFVTGNDISGVPIFLQNVLPGIQNRIPYQNSVILTGQSNSIFPCGANSGGLFGSQIVSNIFVGTGSNNKISLNHSIITGRDITLNSFGSFLPSIVYTGKNISTRPSSGPDKYFWNCAFMSVETIDINLFSTNIIRTFGFLPGLSNSYGNSAERQGGVVGGVRNRFASSNTSFVTGSGNIHTNNTGNGESIICSGLNNSSGTSATPFNRSSIIAGSNMTIGNMTNNSYICGQLNNCGDNTVNNLIGGGRNNSCSSSNNSVVSGTNNSISTTNSAIGSGVSNSISGSFSHSFMTGISGLLSTPAVTAAAVFGKSNLQGSIGGSDRLFMIGNGNLTRANAFSVTRNGTARAGLTFVTSGADFGEYFEAYGQSNERLPLHETVCLIDERFVGKKIIDKNFIDSENGFVHQDIGKIILSSQVPIEIEAIGVTTNYSSFVGNAHEDEWQGKYEKDMYGNIIYVDVEQIEEEDVYDLSMNEMIRFSEEKKISDNGDVYYQRIRQVNVEEIKIPVMEEIPVYNTQGELLEMIKEPKKMKVIKVLRTKKISENYNPTQVYIPRSKRNEWNLIGLRGQVFIKKGQKLIPNSMKIGEHNEFFDKYLI